tara:strand:- start:25 stop:702 length:678 start_codon:yes stop_codon:yes gene_type:complete
MKIILIIQARVNSKRLKGKSIIPIFKKKSSLDLIIEKFIKFNDISKIYVATGPKYKNRKILEILKNKKVDIFFGSENNVRRRFEILIGKENPDLIIRATGDNPLVDVNLTKYLIKYIKKEKNISYIKFDDRFIPTGSGVEIFRSNFFFKHLKTDNSSFAKEHVTYHMMKKKGAAYVRPPKKLTTYFPMRITVDNLEDYKFVRYIYSKINNPNIIKIEAFFKKLIK